MRQDDGDGAGEGPADARGNRVYGIRALAEELGVTARAVRFYEDRGLITPQRAGKTRVYSRRDRARMILILRGKRLGFSLKEIATFLDLYAVDASQVEQLKLLESKVAEHIAALQQQRRALDQTLSELQEIARLTADTLALKGGVGKKPSSS